MAEQFITLMADLDAAAQETMSGWHKLLTDAGFAGTQTPGLPYHISLASFPLDCEREATEETRRLAETFAPVPVHMSHIGIFAGGRVLFCAPDMDPAGLLRLHEAIMTDSADSGPWTPHATLLIDEPGAVHEAIGILMPSFRPFMAKVVRLHLCAFWPTREILSVELTGTR